MKRDVSRTVCSRLTANAPGAIAVIGLAGTRTHSILAESIRTMAGDAGVTLSANRPCVCRIVDDGQVIDDAVVCVFDGEDGPQAEIHTHGGVRIVQRVIMLFERHGAAVVSAADFHGLLDSSDPVVQRIDLAIQMAGSRRLVEWLLGQRRILPEFMRRLDSIDESERRAFEERSAAARRLLEGLRIAIVGPPNAGKSTLANRLIGHDRIITSDMAGTTRDWVSETALIKGWPVTLTDTAGIRETDCAIESEAIRRGRAAAEGADLTLLVLDGSNAAAAQRSTVEAVLNSATSNRPVLVVINKSDVMSNATQEFIEFAPSAGVLSVSALTGEGFDELEAAIERTLKLDLLKTALPTAFFELGAPAFS